MQLIKICHSIVRVWLVGLSIFLSFLSVGVWAEASPAIKVNLASTTAWTFRPEGEARARTLSVPAGGWRLNGFPGVTAGMYERRIVVPKLPGAAGQVTYLAFEAVNWEAVVSVGPDA